MPAYNYKATVDDVGTSITHKTVGKDGDHISEEIKFNNNGHVEISTDLRTEEHNYTDSVKTNHGEAVFSYDKNMSTAVPNGRNETISGSTIAIDGNLSYIVNKGPMLAEKEKQKLVAARSQSDTKPDPLSLKALGDLLKPEPHILKRAAYGIMTKEDIEMAENIPFPPKPQTPAELLASYLAQYSYIFALTSSKGASQVAKVYANDVQEKAKAFREEKEKMLDEITDPFKKAEKTSEYMDAIKNIQKVLTSPSTQNADRVQNFDEKEFKKKAGEVIENMTEAERLC